MDHRRKVLDVVDKLQQWLECHDDLCEVPCVIAEISATTEAILIDGMTLWDSESGYSDESIDRDTDNPDFAACVQCYRFFLTNRKVFMSLPALRSKA